MKRAGRLQGISSLELAEQAVHLLRTAPATALALYYIGALPFVLGFLYFWMEMGSSAFAEGHLPGRALMVAVLFLWMRFWQAVFARHLRAALSGVPPPRLDWTYCRRVAFTQAALEWTGLFLMPLSLVLTFPFAWVYAFYQSLLVQAGGEAVNLRDSLKRAWCQAKLWPNQNHLFLLVLGAFALVVFANWCLVSYTLPQLVKMCFGVESVFTRSPESIANSTFFTVMLGLSYLCVDPIVKAGYVLRCFYGESLQSGEDLKTELRQSAAGTARTRAAVVAVVSLASVLGANGATSNPGVDLEGGLSRSSPASIGQLQQTTEERLRTLENANTPRIADALATVLPLPEGEDRGEGEPVIQVSAAALSGLFGFVSDFGFRISDFHPPTLLASTALPPETPASPSTGSSPSSSLFPNELDRTIREVIQQDKYVWRQPREETVKPETGQEGFINRFIDGMGNVVRDCAKAVRDFFKGLFPSNPVNVAPRLPGPAPAVDLRLLIWVLIMVVAAALTLLFFRAWMSRTRRFAPATSEPVQQPEPDLKDETVSADHLPEDGWTKLARELWQRGELRLALRAFYFSSLAHLAGCNLISLARFKSNHDYELELHRRAHSFPEMLALFGETVSVFDRTWYGLHDIDSDLLTRFAANVARIKGGGA